MQAAAPSTSPGSGGPTGSEVGVPGIHGSRARGLCTGLGMHPAPLHARPKPWGAREVMPVEFCFAEGYKDLTGKGLCWFKAVVCIDEACI